MPLPNFLIIGAQKSGTTWLNWKLRQHPQVYMPEQEIHFFDRAKNFNLGLDWYSSHFAQAKGFEAIGEKTPDYLTVDHNRITNLMPDIHIRIKECLPDVKLIVSLRNPVDRAISAVYHMLRMGLLSPWDDINDLLIGPKRYLIENLGIYEYGYYFRQLRPYYEQFGPRRILILVFETDIKANPERGLSKVCDFLEIDNSYKFEELEEPANAFRHSWLLLMTNYYLPSASPLIRRINRFLPVYRSNLRLSTITQLTAHFAEENLKLADLTKCNFDVWQNVDHLSSFM